ncbi:DHH family phosphoesterase [Deltaproteobacteria bacterium OttesenSCG-928-K17]|nr:DHH family phosphoesterase [Deltaproteobacteria bacterium OttesenSCG-928-K17]
MTDCRPGLISAEILALFQKATRPLILCHHNPDGDALGSAAGIAGAFAAQGARPDVFLLGTWSEHLGFLLEGLAPVQDVADISAYDLTVLLDCHGFDRLGPEGSALAAKISEARTPVVIIDHHLLGENETAGPLWIHDAAASSTGELVWLLIKALGWKVTAASARGLLMALVSDTGFFSQSNATAGAFRAAADLVEAGGDIEDIKRRLHMEQPLRRLKLMGLALGTLSTHFDGRLGVMTVTPDMLAEAGAQMSDTEEFVEIARSLSGVALAAFIKDAGKGPGSIRVSLRSRPEINARGLAVFFGGGGHKQASAYNDPRAADSREALANLLAEAGRFL